MRWKHCRCGVRICRCWKVCINCQVSRVLSLPSLDRSGRRSLRLRAWCSCDSVRRDPSRTFCTVCSRDRFLKSETWECAFVATTFQIVQWRMRRCRHDIVVAYILDQVPCATQNTTGGELVDAHRIRIVDSWEKCSLLKCIDSNALLTCHREQQEVVGEHRYCKVVCSLCKNVKV